MKLEPEIKPATINWRIYSLVKFGVLARIGRGKFTLGEGKNFIPALTRSLKILNKRLHDQFPYLQTCIWNTSLLNEFMLHQPGRFYTLVEVDKDGVESVFYFLKGNSKNVFLDPKPDILSRYASEVQNAIIVRTLVSEAPTQVIQGVNTTTIEKLLVDIFSDDTLFASQQGGELLEIFREALSKYAVNESRMLRYANRKRKKAKLEPYLENISNYRQQTGNAANL